MKNFFAAVCVFVILFLFPLVLIATVAQTQLSGPVALKQLVRDAQIAEQIPDLIVAKMQESTEGEQEVSEEENESDKQGVINTRAQIANALPPTTVNTIFDQVIDSGAVWWKSGDPLEEFPLVINIAPYKDEVQPLLKNTELITNEDGSLPDTIDLSALLQIEAQNKPDEFLKYNEQITQARESIARALTLTIIGWVVIALSLVGIGLLIRTPGERVAQWFGWTGAVLFLEAVVLLALVYFFPSFIEPLISSDGAPAEATVAFSLIQALATTLWHGIAVAVFVLLVWMIAAFGTQAKLRRK